MSVDLADRYGTRPGRRPLVIGISIVIAAIAIVWVSWATWLQATPGVSSAINTWEVVDDHTVTVVAKVRLDDDVDTPVCRVQALADDHTTVGELQFTPVDGINEQTISTERGASSVNWIGCWSKDQPGAK
ncbi:DUF4307 domain-containing protein [Nocardioides alcanivorans]|uniref:DUF4307 domain-containing protein n=1 Tax=Nocardioides alcanivorans TaxID=2897352 RepID=UPI001F46CFAC|nr:DUF4307 domain-containing protein [Nocardioides alcanivorans]